MARKRSDANLKEAMGLMRKARQDEEEQGVSPSSVAPAAVLLETAKKTRKKKVDHARVTLHLRRDLVERARGALAYALYKKHGDIKSLSQLFDRALERELNYLEQELEPEGGSFPALAETPRTGRPQGT